MFKHALIQDAAYASLLRSTRQGYHQAIAQLFEQQFPELVETQPEVVAHHYTEAGLTAQAIPYWQKAGQRAAQHSANAEAIGHLTKGLELIKTLPDTPERAQRELALQIALGNALIATKGYAAPEVEKVYSRARELYQQVGEMSQLFPTLYGLWAFHFVGAKHQTAYEIGEEFLRLAQRERHPARVVAHRALGWPLLCMGELASAHEHCEQIVTLYDPQQHRSLAFLYGQDPGVSGISYGSWAQWLLGYPDQALQRSHKAIALAREISHPLSLAYALGFAAVLLQLRRDTNAVQERAEATIRLCAELEMPLWRAWAIVLRGWALTQQGVLQEGIAQIREGLDAAQATGAAAYQPHFLALLAEAYGKAEQTEEGLTVLAEALTMVDKTGERYYEAELYRLKGMLTLQSQASPGQVQGKSQASPDKSKNTNPQPLTPDPQAEAEACFLKAIAIAQKQQAKSLELRAVMSLSRLWQQQALEQGAGSLEQGARTTHDEARTKLAEAHKLLSDVYNWFTEGFDTKDLQDAKELLDRLS